MPRNSSGVYSLPAGNPVTSFTVITTAWANPTMSDIANEITNSLDRDGRGGMRAPFRIFDGSLSQPGLGFLNEVGIGLWRESAGLMHLVNSGTNVISILPSRARFPQQVEVVNGVMHKVAGQYSWIVKNEAGTLKIMPSTAVDGETWDATKATTWNPTTGVPTFPAGAGTYVRITGDTMTGNLGIGTGVTPSWAVTVTAGGSVISKVAATQAATFAVGVKAGLLGEDARADIKFITATNGVGGDSSIEFWTNTYGIGYAARMTIDKAGNVGIGSAPNAWLSTARVLQVNARSSLASIGANDVHITNNAFFDAGSTWRYIATAEATNYYQSDGIHVFRRAASGASGSPITWTNTLEMSASGNVGIGVTPTSKFHVSGGRSLFYANNETFALGVGYGSGAGIFYIGASNSATPDLVFSQVGGAEKMRLTNAGFLGIGVTPTVALDVYGAGRFASGLVATAGGAVGTNQGLHLFYNTGVAWIYSFQPGVDWFPLKMQAKNYELQINNATKFLIDSTGSIQFCGDANLNLQVAGGNPVFNFDTGGDGFVYNRAGNQLELWINNAIQQRWASSEYRPSGRVAQYVLGALANGGGAWRWDLTATAHGVTPGANISFDIQNPASGEVKRVWVRGAFQVSFTVNGGAFSWVTGFPTWGANGTLVTLVCVDSNYVLGTTAPV